MHKSPANGISEMEFTCSGIRNCICSWSILYGSIPKHDQFHWNGDVWLETFVAFALFSDCWTELVKVSSVISDWFTNWVSSITFHFRYGISLKSKDYFSWYKNMVQLKKIAQRTHWMNAWIITNHDTFQNTRQKYLYLLMVCSFISWRSKVGSDR